MGSIVIREFHDALNSVSQPTTKSAQYADAMSNIVLSTRNTVAKKAGTEPINSSAFASGSEILSMYDFLFHKGDTVRKMIFNAGTSMYEVHIPSGVAGAIKSGLTAREFQYEVSDRVAYFGNGVDMLKYYAIAGYSLFGDEEQILDETNTQLAQSFVSLHGNDRECASVSLALKRTGAIPSSTKITIEIQGDSSGDPDGSAITNGTSQQIDGDDILTSWDWVSFTFASQPTLVAGTTYWIVLKTSAGLTSGLDLGWAVDGSSPTYDDGNFSTFASAVWTADTTKDALFQVFVQPDLWGIVAPTTAPTVSGSSVNNPANDTTANQDADEELLDTGGLAQSWKFTGDDDRTVSAVQLYMQKTGTPGGSLQVTIRSDSSGKPSSSILAKSQTVTSDGLGASYGFETFTLEEAVTLSVGIKYWLVLEGDQLYIDNFSAGVTSVDWGVDSSSPAYTDGEFARMATAGTWTLDSSMDAFFRITSSLFSAGGRKYAISFKNSVTGHVSNRSPGSARSGNFDSVTLSGFEVPTDIQVDRLVIWATTDGGEIFFLLVEQQINLESTIVPFTDSEPSGYLQVTSGAGDGVEGSYVELIASTASNANWVTVGLIVEDLNASQIGQLDLAIGGAGSEVDFVEDIVYAMIDSANDGNKPMIVSFPFTIAAGSRISARIKDNIGTAEAYNISLNIYNPDTSGGSGGPTTFVDGPVTIDDLDFTQEAPLDNDPPPAGDIISRVRDSIIIAGVQETPHQAFYSAGLGQTLIGVLDESFPALNLVTVPSGSERIYNIGSIDGFPVVFTPDQLFTVAGESPESFRIVELRGGKGVGSVSKTGSAPTELGLFFMSTDKKVYIIPTLNHVPQIVSALVEDEFEDIVSDSSLLSISAMEKIRMTYWHFGDRHWLVTTMPTGSPSTLDNEMWIYDIDLHNEHPSRGWMGPLTLAGGEGYQSLRVITDAKHDKRLLIGDEGGFIREYGIGNQDDSTNFSASYTFPFMDDNKPNIVKVGLVAEVVIPVGQTVPANFLQVSYDSETDFENVPLVKVNEMVRGASDHRYRGYLLKQFTRIKPKINFESEDAVGELWQLRIDYDDLFDTRGFINDA